MTQTQKFLFHSVGGGGRRFPRLPPTRRHPPSCLDQACHCRPPKYRRLGHRLLCQTCPAGGARRGRLCSPFWAATGRIPRFCRRRAPQRWWAPPPRRRTIIRSRRRNAQLAQTWMSGTNCGGDIRRQEAIIQRWLPPPRHRFCECVRIQVFIYDWSIQILSQNIYVLDVSTEYCQNDQDFILMWLFFMFEIGILKGFLTRSGPFDIAKL